MYYSLGCGFCKTIGTSGGDGYAPKTQCRLRDWHRFSPDRERNPFLKCDTQKTLDISLLFAWPLFCFSLLAVLLRSSHSSILQKAKQEGVSCGWILYPSTETSMRVYTSLVLIALTRKCDELTLILFLRSVLNLARTENAYTRLAPGQNRVEALVWHKLSTVGGRHTDHKPLFFL